jgi:hypothetical protein
MAVCHGLEMEVDRLALKDQVILPPQIIHQPMPLHSLRTFHYTPAPTLYVCNFLQERPKSTNFES